MKRSSVEDILACFLALSGKVTENFASQFARTEAVLLIVEGPLYSFNNSNHVKIFDFFTRHASLSNFFHVHVKIEAITFHV